MSEAGLKQFLHLPDAEWDVMKELWKESGPVKSSELLLQLNQKKHWSISTLHALLYRLQKRGFVAVQKRMRFNYYFPLVEEQQYREQETRNFFERMYGNSLPILMKTLIAGKMIGKSDLEELEEFLRETKQSGL